jgi:hypothetical protein
VRPDGSSMTTREQFLEVFNKSTASDSDRAIKTLRCLLLNDSSNLWIGKQAIRLFRLRLVYSLSIRLNALVVLKCDIYHDPWV